MPWFPKPYADAAARLRVPGGFLLAVLFFWMARPSWGSMAAGVPVSALGLALRTWAAGHLEKNQRVATSGPYGYLRNPLYLGTLLVAAGLIIVSRQWIVGALFAAVFVLVYLPVIQLEEEHLRKLFPEYAAYAERVPLLWPRFGGIRPNHHFRLSLWMRNEEWKALGGFLIALAILAWQAAYSAP